LEGSVSIIKVAPGASQYCVISHDADASYAKSWEKALQLISSSFLLSSVCRHTLQLSLIAGRIVIPSGSSCLDNRPIKLPVGLKNNADALSYRCVENNYISATLEGMLNTSAVSVYASLTLAYQ
jgi:hypothetical protein